MKLNDRTESIFFILSTSTMKMESNKFVYAQV
jgi:hypothetical protein